MRPFLCQYHHFHHIRTVTWCCPQIVLHLPHIVFPVAVRLPVRLAVIPALFDFQFRAVRAYRQLAPYEEFRLAHLGFLEPAHAEAGGAVPTQALLHEDVLSVSNLVHPGAFEHGLAGPFDGQKVWASSADVKVTHGSPTGFAGRGCPCPGSHGLPSGRTLPGGSLRCPWTA